MSEKKSERIDPRNQLIQRGNNDGVYTSREPGGVKQMSCVPLRCDEIAVGDRNRKGVGIVDVVDRPRRLGVSVSSSEERDPDVGTRH